MNSKKIKRSECREAALQILFAEYFSDQQMARAIAGVEISQTIESFQDTRKALNEHIAAATRTIRVLEKASEALEVVVKPAEERKSRPVSDSAVSSVEQVAASRGQLIEALQNLTQVVHKTSALFDSDGFTVRLIQTYDRRQERVKDVLQRCLEGWKVRRLTLEDSAALRLGVTELLFFEDVPPKVILNEYIELSRKYGTDESPKLVNGVLDRVLRDFPREKETKEG